MATLAPSLRRLFNEIDARWPNRDRRTDGWIGDAAHQARKSDHNPDSRGIVHAIDIDRDGIEPYSVVEACISENRPTEYVIYNRQIWSRTRDFKPRAYTGENPHTSHIHVSIRYGTSWEADTWAWGVADIGKGVGSADKPGPGDDMGNWANTFGATADYFTEAGIRIRGTARTLEWLMSGGQ